MENKLLKLVDRVYIDTIMSDNNIDFVVVFKRQSKNIPERADRVVWCISEQKYIYGDEFKYTVLVGEDEKPKFDASDKNKERVKNSYRRGLTLCGSAFYDVDGKLYEIVNPLEPHVLLYDINEHPEYLH